MIRPRGYCTLRYKRPASSRVAALHPLRDALQARHPVHARGSPVLPERPTRLLAVGDERGGPVLGGLAPTVDAVVGSPHRVNRRREKIHEQSIPVTRVDAVVHEVRLDRDWGRERGCLVVQTYRVENARLLLLTAGVVVGVPAVAAVDAAAAVSSSAAVSAAAARARVAGIAATRALLATRVRAGAV